MFVLQPSGANPVPVTNYIQKQMTVCGGDPHVVWNNVDQGNGNYTWTAIDNQINQWVRLGKKANLIVRAVSDARPNNGTPAYVLNDPNYQSATCQENNNGVDLQYPVYYSGSFKNNYKTFIQAVMNPCGGNPNIGYIRFGLARGGEVFPACLTQVMTFSGFTTIDQFNTQWESYITEMTNFQKSLQTQITQIIASQGRAVQLMAALDQYGSPTQYAVNDFEGANAKSLGFGFGMQGLSTNEVPANKAGRSCTADWCSLFQSQAGIVPLELQTMGYPLDSGNRSGTGLVGGPLGPRGTPASRCWTRRQGPPSGRGRPPHEVLPTART